MADYYQDSVFAGTGRTEAASDVNPLLAEFLGPPRLARQEAPRQPDVARTEGIDTQLLQARDYERQGETALTDAIRGLRFTQRGAQPLAVPFREQYTVPADTTPLGLATRVLGPNSSQEQREHFARQILEANDLEGEIGTEQLERGAVIRLPGQRADGGVVTRNDADAATTTSWHDGSVRVDYDDGTGHVVATTRDGSITCRWNRTSQDGNARIVATDNLQTETRPGGITIQRRPQGRNEDGDTRWAVTRLVNDGRTFDLSYPAGSAEPNQVVVTEGNGSWNTYRRNANGELVSRGDSSGIRIDSENPERIEVYARTVTGGRVTRIYESGEVERTDMDGQRDYHRFRDQVGRTIEELYDHPGDTNPSQINLVTREGQRIQLGRTPAGRYTAPYSVGGREVGTIEYADNGDLMFDNHSTQIVRTERSDGGIVTTVNRPHDRAEETLILNGETVRTERDRNGNNISQQYRDGRGRVITRQFESNGTTVSSMSITGADGSRAELRLDRNTGMLLGQRRDRDDNVVDNVLVQGDRLISTNRRSGACTIEQLSWTSDGQLMSGRGTPNTNLGTYTRTHAATGTRIVEFAGGGRTDFIGRDGTTEGTTITGERSSIRRDGTATVEHPDHTGVRLNADNTIDRWGPRAADNVRGERLTRVEAEYLRTHPDIDRRDFAEIHRRLGGHAFEIDRFYNAMRTVDTARNLSNEERSAVRRNLMSHVARPQEIYQGDSWCCNVGTIQRDMAMQSPDRYIQTVVGALSDGRLRTTSGTDVRLDPANLRLQDTTGRDLASRIFQTASLAVEFHPGTFRNTEDGVGQLRDSRGNRVNFGGLELYRMAHLRYELTGQQLAMVHVSSANDLATLFRENGNRPMILDVQGNRPPFSEPGAGGSDAHGGHVVTLTRVDQGPPLRFYVQNQWGLDQDHSTPARALDAEELMRNMQIHQIPGQHGRTALILTAHPRTPVDHTKVYEFRDGRIQENEGETRRERQRRERQRT